MGTTATLVQTSGAISVFAASKHIKKGRRLCRIVQWRRSDQSETVVEMARRRGQNPEWRVGGWSTEPNIAVRTARGKRRGAMERFCCLNLHFLCHYAEQKIKVKDAKIDWGQKHIMRLYMKKALLNLNGFIWEYCLLLLLLWRKDGVKKGSFNVGLASNKRCSGGANKCLRVKIWTVCF